MCARATAWTRASACACACTVSGQLEHNGHGYLRKGHTFDVMLPGLIFTLFGLSHLQQILGERAVFPDVAPIANECKWYYTQSQADKRKHAASPVNPESIEHRLCRQREDSSEDALRAARCGLLLDCSG